LQNSSPIGLYISSNSQPFLLAGKYEGTVLGLDIGCFGELSAGVNDVYTFIARSRAVSYVGRYDDKSPKKALGMFRSRICRVWGHAAIFAWSDLILDRSRKLVGLESPAACATRAGGDPDPNIDNCDLFHAQSPDTGRGLHARSWRANRDVVVKRYFLGFCSGVNLLALLLDGPSGGENINRRLAAGSGHLGPCERRAPLQEHHAFRRSCSPART